MMNCLDFDIEQEREELRRLFINMLPSNLRMRVLLESLSQLSTGWSPDPDDEMGSIARGIVSREKAFSGLQRRNLEKQAKAAERRPYFIARKEEHRRTNPRQSERQINRLIAKAAAERFGWKVSEKQVREATASIFSKEESRTSNK